MLTVTEIIEYLKRVQAMAKTGLTYTKDAYDLERYEELRDMTNGLLAKLSETPLDNIETQFANLEDDYPTPKIDVRAVVIQDGKLVLVREKADGKWAMPGGWCDIGYTVAENAVKEVAEETGLEVEAKRVLAVWDKKCHQHPDDLHYVYKICLLCEVTGGMLQPGHEVLDAGFFSLSQLPELSEPRNTNRQIETLVGQAAREQTSLFD